MGVILLTVEVCGAFLDQGLHYSQVFTQVGKGFSEVKPEGLIHFRVVTWSNSEAEAAGGQMCDDVCLLGGGNRMAGPGWDDGCAEEDGLGFHSCHGKQGNRVRVSARK